MLTPGPAALRAAGRFYEHSLRAAGMLGRRAVLLVGDDPGNRPSSLPDGRPDLDELVGAAVNEEVVVERVEQVAHGVGVLVQSVGRVIVRVETGGL